MISNTDRSGVFGASDTRYVMAKNRESKSWKQWWDTKIGLMESKQLGGAYIRAGNIYEHKILEAINEKMDMDGQISYGKYLLRVNYDGYMEGVIYEVKTHKAENEFKISRAYWLQAQVEAFLYQEMAEQYFLPPFKKIYIASYPLYPDEYDATFESATVDPNRISYHEIKYDPSWIKGEYLPNIKELARKLKKARRRLIEAESVETVKDDRHIQKD